MSTRQKVNALLLALLCATAFGAPAVTSYISFEDTNFGGAVYIDDQGSAVGAINLISGGQIGSYGEFANNGWWITSGDSLAVPTPITGSGSVAIWARLAETAVKHNYPLLWDSAPEGYAQAWKVYTSFSNNGVIEPYTISTRVHNSSWVVLSTATPVKEQWEHYVFTWSDNGNGTYDIALYLNGALVTSQAGKTLTAMDDVIRIGGGGLSLGHCKWQGDMDEVYVFDAALTAAEVTDIYTLAKAAERISEPIPYAGTVVNVPGLQTLSWTAPSGITPDEYQVYFSSDDTDFTGVSPVIVTGTSADVTIDQNGTSYWRVDSVAGQQTYTGLVYTIEADFSAYNPTPADGGEANDPSQLLEWDCNVPGGTYEVYITDSLIDGTTDPNFADVTPISVSTKSTTVAVENLKTYYWRVDVIDGAEIYEGDVWAFDTFLSILRPAALAHISFEDNFGGARYIDDQSGVEGDIQFVSGGTVGKAGEFLNPLGRGVTTGGTGDCLALPYQVGDSGTVSMYMNVESFIEAMTAFNIGADGDTTNIWKVYFTATNISPRFSGWSAGPAVPAANDWFHFAITWERSDPTVNFKMYYDGVLVYTGSQTWVAPAGSTIYAGAAHPWAQKFDGLMDEFYAFDKAMNADEVVALYANANKRAYDPKPFCGGGYPAAGILNWKAPTDVDNPVYNLYISTDTTFYAVEPIITNDISYDASALLVGEDVTYYWRVDVVDGATTYDGIVWTFSTTFSDYDFNLDGSVDYIDYSVVSANWLQTTVVVEEADMIIDDFDSYFAVPGDPNATDNWLPRESFASSQYGIKSVDVVSANGGQALELTYDFTGVSGQTDWALADFKFLFDSPIDLSEYAYFEFKVNCDADNSIEDHLAIKFLSGPSADYGDTIYPSLWQLNATDGATTNMTPGWQTITVDISDREDLTEVVGLVLGVSTWPEIDQPTYTGERGYGVVMFDDIRLFTERICSGEQVADLDGDCSVTVDDLIIFATEWLEQ